MIINTEREPLYSLYFLGGVIINILKSTKSETIDSLYLKFQKDITASGADTGQAYPSYCRAFPVLRDSVLHLPFCPQKHR